MASLIHLGRTVLIQAEVLVGITFFVQGGLVDAQSTVPIPVALSSAEAEYMGACNLGIMICHFRELKYEFEKLRSTEYNFDETTTTAPSIFFTDNQKTSVLAEVMKVTR